MSPGGTARVWWTIDTTRERAMTLTTLRSRIGALLALGRSEDGQAMVEYALLVSLIALACFAVVSTFGLGISTLYSRVNALVP